ncbi:MAG: hypothetical protein IPK15_13200 [Verrucomicrobia bacterium]|nr:hypothetical protein [Verrucomicrobiota bacterium]
MSSPAIDALKEGEAILQEVSQSVEKCFLGLGYVLEKLPGVSERLVRQSQRYSEVSSGRASGNATFEETIQLIEEPLAFIDQSQDEVRNLIRALEELQQRIHRLIASEDSLNRAVAPLTYIQTLFRVESTGLPHAVQQMFLALTEDIERLHERVSQTFGEKFAVLRVASETIQRVASQLREEIRSNGTALRDKRKKVEAALAQLNLDLKSNEARGVQLNSVSRVIEREAGMLVISLQAQDIVNQKLAHIVGALSQVQERMTPETWLAPRESARQDIAYCAVSSRLQATQLEGVGADLEQAHEQIKRATVEIGTQVRKLEEDYLRTDSQQQNAAGTDALIQVLLDTMAEVRAMSDRAVNSAEKAFAAISPIGGMASNLTGVMRQLSAQIHLIALNAQVQAAHNCGGTGLEVLASSTATISIETSEISERVASGVDALTEELNRLVAAFAKLRDDGAAQRDRISGRGRTKEGELNSIREGTGKELDALRESVHQIRGHLESMETENQLPTIAGEKLSRLSEVLVAAANTMETPLKSAGVVINPASFSAELSKRYSVASEHELHRRFFNEPGAKASPAPSLASKQTDDEIL